MATDVVMEEETRDGKEMAEPLIPFSTIALLQIVKDAQAQHGLRHGDYNRYRKYCTDHLKRMRRAEKFTHQHKCVKRHKAKFAKKVITDESFTSEKFFHIMLFECERRWARAMNDKTFLEDNPLSRRRQSMKMNLRRAVYHANKLDSMVRNSPRCDAPTKLEVQAYLAYLIGIVAFEEKHWAEARDSLKAAKTVYEKLAEATHNTALTNLYRARCREIQPQLRLCEFNCEETSSQVAKMGELMAIRMQISDKEGIDKLIAEMRTKSAADDVVEIVWGGEKATVLDEKCRTVILGWRQADTELAECHGPKEKMALYEKQLADTRDALDKISDTIRRKTAENADTETLNVVRSYLDFLRLSRTAERYLAMIENTKLEKKYRPQDLLRLYDSVIEIFKEVKELNNAIRDNDLITAYNARIEFYQAFRCHYMAGAYSALGKAAEAAALFHRAAERVEKARKLLTAVSKSNAFLHEKPDELDALLKQNESARVTAKTQRLTSALSDTKKAELIDNRPLIETLDEWRRLPTQKSELSKVDLVRFPPALLPMPTKPVLFDLATNHIRMPQEYLESRLTKLEEDRKTSQPKPSAKGGKKGAANRAQNTKEKVEAAAVDDQQGGISGMVKGWFWGKK